METEYMLTDSKAATRAALKRPVDSAAEPPGDWKLTIEEHELSRDGTYKN